ncbi:MAG: FTR1 family protein, partial [Oscillospiraceae bacterium]|nr:FTR1 family protein [Oscillospiraceae bacterium]
MNRLKRGFSFLLIMVIVVSAFTGITAFADDASSTRWADASDEIDKYLDAAFESWLEGDFKTAYSNVSDAYFRVYETTGFERQTMSYVSGNRKNAVEMQFSACKAAVKREETDLDTKIKVRSALTKLKSMIREDGNKLAALQGGVQSEMKYYLHGELVSSDPYADFSSDPNAAVKYESWYEAATLIKELLDTAYMGYLDKDYQTAEDNLDTAYYTVYEESGLNHRIYTDLSLQDREKMDGHFEKLRGLVSSAEEKYQKNKYRTSTDVAKNDILKLAKALDEKEAAEKAAAAAQTAEAAAAESGGEEAKQSDPRLLTFLGAFGIIVREGLEAILVIAGMIAYLVKSGNQRTLRNVYIGSILGVLASFVAAWLLSYLKRVWTGAGQSQEVIEGITALIAVCVLFYVSNWMISKSEAASWSRYIDG